MNLGSLQGLKVIDLSRVLAGPYCTQMLADHGAEVIKIEPPQGDETRAWGPPFDADGTAAYYLGLNRNKQGRVMDLQQPAAREQLLALLADADVLVENFKPGTMERWGLGYDVLGQRHPRLVYCRVSGFGADGPQGGLPGYDAVIQAQSGMMSVNGESDAAGGTPMRMGVAVVDMVTGLNAALGILLALRERDASGRGQFVESALFDNGLAFMHPHSANHLLDGRVPGRSGNAHATIYPYDSLATATEPIFLAVGTDRQFATLCALLGDETLASHEHYVSNRARSIHRVALKARLEVLLAHRECQALVQALINAGVPCAAVQNTAQAFADPHTQHRSMVVELATANGDTYRGVASPIKLSRTPATYRHPPPGKLTELAGK